MTTREMVAAGLAAAAENLPPGFVIVAIDDLRLDQAAAIVGDGDEYWRLTMPMVLERFRMSYDDYWSLTVAEHRALVEHGA